jgi:hypothetical protein
MTGEGSGSGLGGNKESGSNVDMLNQMAEKMKIKEEDILTKDEFDAIDFGLGPEDTFVIIKDVLTKFTGISHHPESIGKKSPELVETNEKFLNRINFAHRQNNGEDEFSAL